MALQGVVHQENPDFLSHLSNVKHDRDLELPVHEGLIRVGNQVIQHILGEKK